MKAIDTFKMDKSVLFQLYPFLKNQTKGNTGTRKTPYERLESVELMRQINYGYDPTTTRLQRVLEVAQLTSS